MSPQQLRAYTAACEADPQCRCPLVHYGGKFSDNNDENDPIRWRDAGYLDHRVSPDIAAAAITDHLHTRIGSLQAAGQDPPSCCLDGGGWWEVVNRQKSGPEMLETCLQSKLSAYLAAHCVRLGLPRTLIENMEKA